MFSNPGSFSNVNPSTDNWINGFFGIGGFYLCCVANLTLHVQRSYLPERRDQRIKLRLMLFTSIKARLNRSWERSFSGTVEMISNPQRYLFSLIT